jgi:hypothetical protein
MNKCETCKHLYASYDVWRCHKLHENDSPIWADEFGAGLIISEPAKFGCVFWESKEVANASSPEEHSS